MRYVLIMAGGSGKRLWPLSRQGMPKQLLKIVGGSSLLRIAYERIESVVPAENVLVCTGATTPRSWRRSCRRSSRPTFWVSPRAGDSLNAIAWPAAILAARDPDAVMAVVASDHVMRPVESFQAALIEGFAVAESDPLALVTFGVLPTCAHTGFGYLHRGAALRDHPSAHECWPSRRSRTR